MYNVTIKIKKGASRKEYKMKLKDFLKHCNNSFNVRIEEKFIPIADAKPRVLLENLATETSSQTVGLICAVKDGEITVSIIPRKQEK